MSETSELREAIEKLNATQTKAMSMSWNFYRGVLYGFGFFIGGTVLIAVIVYILSFFNTAPVVGEYISKILHIINTTK
jgi:hypothetical protein